MEDKKHFDFARFDIDAMDSWVDVYNYNQSYPDNLIRLTEQFIAYPYKERQTILFLAYVLMPTALAKVTPLLMIYGLPGTGKSITGLWASKIRNMPIFSSGDTASSLRNAIDAMRWKQEYEQNVLLIWDDIDPNVLEAKPDIYRMLKYGYNRATDTISIASAKAGQNIKFKTFSTKIISSIHPIYAMNKFSELGRRCLVLQTLKAEALGINELIDFQLINWNGFSDIYDDFWKNETICQAYILQRKSLARKKHSSISSDKWILSLDLMTTALTIGLFETQSDCIKFMSDYWQWHDELLATENGALKGLLDEYIQELKIRHDEVVNAINTPLPFILQPPMIKQRINHWSSQGALETRVDPRTLAQVMSILGFKLTPKGWETRQNA